MQVIDLFSAASNGLNSADYGLLAMRVAAGGFFAISGYHKLFNPVRKVAVAKVMVDDHVPFPEFMKYWVPAWEFVGGTMLVAGLASAFAAAVLAIICLVACCCEARSKVNSYQPLDAADRVDDYLYLPEVLYLIMLAVIILSGPGALRLDALL